MFIQYSLIISLFLICISVAQASSLGINRPLAIVGQTKVSLYTFDLYNTELYSPDGHYHPAMSEYAFKTTYLRDIKSQQLMKHTIKHWANLGIDPEEYAPYIPRLKELCRDVKKGDRFIAHITPAQTDFYFNDQFVGSIQSPEFGPLFGAIWLSPNVSKPKLRAQLIGSI